MEPSHLLCLIIRIVLIILLIYLTQSLSNRCHFFLSRSLRCLRCLRWLESLRYRWRLLFSLFKSVDHNFVVCQELFLVLVSSVAGL